LPNWYRGSQAQETIVVLRTYPTTTTIGAYGSEDGFATPRTEFGDDEEIMVAGTVGAVDRGDLTGVAMTILVDGVVVGTTPLYGFDGTVRNENPIDILMDKNHVLTPFFTTEVPSPAGFPIGWILVPLIVGGVLIGYLLSRKK